MTVSKAEGQKIVDELRPLLDKVFSEHGLATPQIRWTYGTGFELKAKATMETLNESGVNTSSMEAQYYIAFGYKSTTDWELTAPLGTRFTSNGKEYLFAGIAAKRRKYPIYCKNVATGEYTLFTESIIKKINDAALAASK